MGIHCAARKAAQLDNRSDSVAARDDLFDSQRGLNEAACEVNAAPSELLDMSTRNKADATRSVLLLIEPPRFAAS